VLLPNSNALGGNLAFHGNDVWITDFNSDSLWRYNITSGQFSQFLVPEPADVAVDSLGRVWFTDPLEGAIDRLDPATGAVTSTGVGGLIPRELAVAGRWAGLVHSGVHTAGRGLGGDRRVA